MTPTTGIVRNGKIEIPAPVDLTEGAEVRVWLEPNSVDQDDDGPMSEDDIQRALEAMDKIEPLNMTDEEIRDWEKALEEQKAFEIANFDKRAKKLQSYWQ